MLFLIMAAAKYSNYNITFPDWLWTIAIVSYLLVNVYPACRYLYDEYHL